MTTNSTSRYRTSNSDAAEDSWNLQKYSNGVVFDNEMWGANFGVLK